MEAAGSRQFSKLSFEILDTMIAMIVYLLTVGDTIHTITD
jgi:hypothetical protein